MSEFFFFFFFLRFLLIFHKGIPGGSVVKNLHASAEVMGLIPGMGRSSGEKKMVTHSSILVWDIPWTEEPGELQSMGSQRVGHNFATKQQQSLHAKDCFQAII